jgi:hypothetical protein
MYLSLKQTQELLRIAESDDPKAELEEFLAQYGYDEGEDDDLIYEEEKMWEIYRYAIGISKKKKETE